MINFYRDSNMKEFKYFGKGSLVVLTSNKELATSNT